MCIACSENLQFTFNNTNLLRKFLTSQFKIRPSKYTGLCKKHQRKVTNAIKNARFMALLPYTRNQLTKSYSQSNTQNQIVQQRN